MKTQPESTIKYSRLHEQVGNIATATYEIRTNSDFDRNSARGLDKLEVFADEFAHEFKHIKIKTPKLTLNENAETINRCRKEIQTEYKKIAESVHLNDNLKIRYLERYISQVEKDYSANHIPDAEALGKYEGLSAIKEDLKRRTEEINKPKKKKRFFGLF